MYLSKASELQRSKFKFSSVKGSISLQYGDLGASMF